MPTTPYIERDCTFTHAGRTVESGGAVVTPDYAIGYYDAKRNAITNWHGEILGTATVVASWPTPRSYMSGTMCQIEATIDGVTYTGRGAGNNMLWRGKRKASR